jgi:hypothetical protein
MFTAHPTESAHPVLAHVNNSAQCAVFPKIRPFRRLT